MKKVKFKAILLFFTGFLSVFSDVDFMPLKEYSPVWDADSLYVGAGFIADGSEVIVEWKRNSNIALGQLYFILPGNHDSSIFVFHNKIENYPEESATVNMGSFPRGTEIVSKYIVIDTSSEFDNIRDKALYNGQNRPEIDEYVSDLTNGYLAYRWAIAGRLNSSECEIGFEATGGYGFNAIVFVVSGVYVSGAEKFKIPYIHVSPSDTFFTSPIEVFLSIPEDGLKCYQTSIDTIDPIADGAELQIYYTLDGTNPDRNSTLYEGPIIIDETTTIKAFAVLEGDTNWFDSEVMEETYTYTGTANKINIPKNSFITRNNFPINTPVSIYNPQGRVLFTSSNTNEINKFIRNYNGIYILKYLNNGTAVVRKMLFTE